MSAASDHIRTLKERAKLIEATRVFFREREYVEVETPSFSVCPGMDVHLDAFELKHPREDRFLITSPEYYMKRLLAEGADRIFQLSRSFRNKEEGHHHEPEFLMLEWYQCIDSETLLMQETEHLILQLAGLLKKESLTVHLPMFDAELNSSTVMVSLKRPWITLTVEEAIERFAKVHYSDVESNEDLFLEQWVEHVEPAIKRMGKPVWIRAWPQRLASLARIHPEGYAERVELYIGGVELCNGFVELTDPDEQLSRLISQRNERRLANKVVYPVDSAFMGALKKGLPPSYGNALGMDRLIMLLLEKKCIQDVIAFSCIHAPKP